MKTNRTGFALAALGMLVLVACTDQTNSGGTSGPAGTPATAVPVPTLTPTPDSFHAGLAAADSLFDKGKTKHVAVVVVASNGHVFPAKLVIHKKVYYVVWIPDGEKLEITFVKGPPPLPVVDCMKFAPACILSTAIETETPIKNPYEYTGQITKNGVRTKVDPHLEVVK